MENSAVEDIKNKIAKLLESQDEETPKASKLFDLDESDSFFKDLVSKIEHQEPENKIDFYKIEPKSYKKYDDDAFRKDLDNMANPYDQVDVKNIIRSALQIEDESRQIKKKNGIKVQEGKLYQAPKIQNKEEKQIQKVQNQLMKGENQDDEAEDMLLAFELLNKYKKDSKFIQKDLNQMKKQSQLIIRDENSEAIPTKKAKIDVLLTQEERHRSIAEKREKRKQEQKLKEIEKQKQDVRKVTRTKLDKLKANSDISNVIDDSTFLTATDADFLNADPRSSLRIQKVMEAKNQINQQTEQYQEEVKKMQDEIKRYKEEIKKQSMAEKQKQEQMKIKEQLQFEKEIIEKEMQQSKLQMRNFKFNKFLVLVNSLVIRSGRNHKFYAINQLQQHQLNLNLKFKKMKNHHQFSQKHKILKIWANKAKEIVQNRELEIYNKEKARQIVLQNRADNFQLQQLYKVTIKSLKKNVQQEQAQREIEFEHEHRKYQIDNFFANLKQKIEIENQQKQIENEKEAIKDKLRVQTKIEEKLQAVQMAELDESAIQEEEIKEQSPEQVESRLEKSPCNPPDESDTSLLNINIEMRQSVEAQTQTKKPAKKPVDKKVKERHDKLVRPKQVTEMELRAQQRAQKRQELQQLYEEKKKMQEEMEMEAQKQKELEIQQKLNEEKERKKKAKMDEMRAKEEAKIEKEREVERIEEARQFYKKTIMKKCIWKNLMKLIEYKQKKENKADVQCQKWLQRNFIRKFRHAVQIKMYENEQEINRLTDIADSFLEFNIQTRVMGILKSNIQESARDAQFYRKKVCEKYLKIRCLNMWVKLQRFIREENRIILEQQTKIVKKFRKIKLGRKVIEALNDHAQDEKINAQKNVYKHKMWSKVNQWLSDLDQKDCAQSTIEANDQQSTDEKPKPNLSFMSKDMFDEGFEMTKTIENDTLDLNN